MNIFYAPTAVINQYCALDETESRHIVTVLRKKTGDELHLFDGKGNLFSARIDAIGKKEVNLHVTALLKSEPCASPALHIAIAAPKNMERLEWFCEKATEIGVNEITPLLCEHSERKEVRNDRLEKILLSASKQSLKLNLPVLHPMVKFYHFVAEQKNRHQKLIAYCDEKAIHIQNVLTKNTDALVVIGPEGDFSKEEIQMATQNGFRTVSLGKSRLRLETAGIFAAAVFNLVNE